MLLMAATTRPAGKVSANDTPVNVVGFGLASVKVSVVVPSIGMVAAANDLVRPSSAARALDNGAPNIERTDRLVQTIAAQYGMRNAVVDQTVAVVDSRIAANRKAAA